jgi:hypothetical protein
MKKTLYELTKNSKCPFFCKNREKIAKQIKKLPQLVAFDMEFCYFLADKIISELSFVASFSKNPNEANELIDDFILFLKIRIKEEFRKFKKEEK